ncbi:MAG: SHOCT domain-containing protein [Candidatus Nanopelagicales bacterium]|jgi:membrane protease subunit (stomatin/prohibitin family)
MPRIGRAVARTAVVAGTATAVSGKVAQNQADKQAAKEAAAATPAAAEPEADPISEIERLGALKEKGLLTDEEFTAAKAKILGI